MHQSAVGSTGRPFELRLLHPLISDIGMATPQPGPQALFLIVVLSAIPLCCATFDHLQGPSGPVDMDLPFAVGMADLVVSNTSTLNMRSSSAGSTGWQTDLEVSFTRDPPIYGDGDESIGIDINLMVSPGANAKSKPPMSVGTVLTIQLLINAFQAGHIRLMPLAPGADGAASLSTFYHVMLPLAGLLSKEVTSQSITVQIELLDVEWGRLSSQVSPLVSFCVQASARR